jgi:hypothetical protein
MLTKGNQKLQFYSRKHKEDSKIEIKYINKLHRPRTYNSNAKNFERTKFLIINNNCI